MSYNNYGNIPNYNPDYNPAYARLLRQKAWIEQQLNQMQQPYQNIPSIAPQFMNNMPAQQQPNQPNFFIRAVGSIDEAKGYATDPGILYFFIDSGNGKIYHKQLNDKAQTVFVTYVPEEPKKQAAETANIEQIAARLEKLESMIGENKNVQSVSNAESSK